MYATSPDRYGFMIESYKKRLEKDPHNKEMIKTLSFYEECRMKDSEDVPKQYDMEYDLRKCDWIVAKCKDSETYSQNLYAALCNNRFSRDGNEWSCSWRHSGGIVSNLREQGDYINWYCSGITMDDDHPVRGGYLPEGSVSEEVLCDLRRLGWVLIT
jgi:hypothetical protein